MASTVGEVLDKVIKELDGKGSGQKIVQQGAIRVVLNKPGPGFSAGKQKQKRNAASGVTKDLQLYVVRNVPTVADIWFGCLTVWTPQTSPTRTPRIRQQKNSRA
eukprot:jgi/Ulvmu1/41/UM001_0044.1